jgi:hypothetical protein
MKKNCCEKLEALLTLSAVDAYDSKSTDFCGLEDCATVAMTNLKAKKASADFSPENKRALTLFGASTSDTATKPDICASTLANYLTTTTTTTAAPTVPPTTTAGPT